MAISHASTVLQAVASIRNWVVTHIPLAGSMVGYDLFLVIGNARACGANLTLVQARSQLGYAPAEVEAHLGELEQAGLLTLAGAGDDRVLLPTARFAALLDDYQRLFERTFIPRDRLRSTQLLCAVPNAADRELVELLYDRFFDLGWFYLHNYGSTCFMMATMAERVAQLLGHRARIVFGSVEVGNRATGATFLVGAGQARAGQVDGHAFCIVDERILIDFGLGSVRKFYRRDFVWAAAVPYSGQEAPAASVQLADGTTLAWRITPLPAACEAELSACAQHAEVLMPQYLATFPLDHEGRSQ
jgi:hypothetical protein